MNESDITRLTIASQNALLDYTRARKGLILSQDERIASIAATLANFPTQFDVVGVQEAHKSKRRHNGEELSQRLGNGTGYWANHNQKAFPDARRGRSGEYIGLFGPAVNYAEALELGDNRRALFTTIADVAFVTVHLRAGRDGRKKRRDQTKSLVSQIAAFDNAVVFGDLNEPPIPYVAAARHELRRAGFCSVFDVTDQPHPVTFPVEAYRDIIDSSQSWKNPRLLRRRNWSIDDILVRGPRVEVLGAGVLERVIDMNGVRTAASGVPPDGSDHEGIWAALALHALPQDMTEPPASGGSSQGQ